VTPFGTYHSCIRTEPMSEACPACKASNSLSLKLMQDIFFFFLIPFFPSGKTVTSICTNCKQELPYRMLQGSVQERANELLQEVKAPIWAYSGLFFILASLIFGSFLVRHDYEKTAQYIHHPQRGDIYSMQTAEGYEVYKLKDVHADSIFLQANLHVSSSEKGLRNIKENNSEAYVGEMIVLSKDQLLAMLNNKTLLQVDR